MKNTLLIIALLLLFYNVTAQEKVKVEEKGEHLNYIVRYGFFTGGKASLDLTKEIIGKDTFFHARLEGRTAGIFKAIYKVKDIYESYFSPETLLPSKAIRNISEGNYRRYNVVSFDREKNQIHSKRSGVKDVPVGIHDILSAFYYARVKYFNENLKKGQIIKIMTYFSDEEFLLQFRFMGYETIKSRIGKIRCYKIVPIVATGRAFKDADDMTVWISADRNKIPVRAQFNLFLGSLRCDLTNFSNFSMEELKN